MPVCLSAILPYSVNSCRCCKGKIWKKKKKIPKPANGPLGCRVVHCRRALTRSLCSRQTPSCSPGPLFCSQRFPEKRVEISLARLYRTWVSMRKTASCSPLRSTISGWRWLRNINAKRSEMKKKKLEIRLENYKEAMET